MRSLLPDNWSLRWTALERVSPTQSSSPMLISTRRINDTKVVLRRWPMVMSFMLRGYASASLMIHHPAPKNKTVLRPLPKFPTSGLDSAPVRFMLNQ